ncbi:MAG: DUF5107 domain-containing protein [Chloroflexi bacterium]|nr:DUF5107 domain-containing protein [Chloroflexota bacterium]
MNAKIAWRWLGLTVIAALTACSPAQSIAEPSAPPTLTATPVETLPDAPMATATVSAPRPSPAPTSTLAPTATPVATVPEAPMLLTPTVTFTPEVYLPTVMKDWALAVYETQITLTSYAWEQALRPSDPGSPYYPYHDLDRGAVGPPAPRTYTGVILENSFTRITVLPYLGGRILRWEDRLTGQRLTYENPVIMPVNANWGYRGWWLATGGVEWAFPVEEHGLNEYLPWEYQLLSGENWRGVRVWHTDWRTGMTIEITLRLYGGDNTLVITPRITNPTAEPKPLMFWINAMLTLSGSNAPSNSLRFWVPTEQMKIHSTGDGQLPGPRSLISWPVFGGRDFSYYSEWRYYLGVFATQAQGAMGAYDEDSDLGLVRTYPPATPQGVKLFCLGDLPSDIFTVDNSRYFELWGGLNRTFFPEDYLSLAAGQTLTWDERWYAVHGIGGLAWANAELAAAFKQTAEGVMVGLFAPRAQTVDVVVKQNDLIQGVFLAQLGPDAPFRRAIPGSGAGWTLELWKDGLRLAEIAPY